MLRHKILLKQQQKRVRTSQKYYGKKIS